MGWGGVGGVEIHESLQVTTQTKGKRKGVVTKMWENITMAA